MLDFDPYLITDKYNLSGQINGFKENRHDQSIFSLLSKLHRGVNIKNETHFTKQKNTQINYPFPFRKHGHGLKDTVKYLTNHKEMKYTPVYFLFF